LYMERNNLTGGGNLPSVYVDNSCQNVSILGATYIGDGAVTTQTVVETQGKHVNIQGVSVFGTVDQVVLAPLVGGQISYQTVKHLFMSSGTATNGLFVDSSERRYSDYNNGSESSSFNHTASNLQNSKALSIRNVDTDAVTAFFNGDGSLYLGSTTSAPRIDPAGSSVEFTNSGVPSSIRIGSAIVGAGNVKILTGTGSPEGAATADIGSIFLRTDGGTGTTFWVKEASSGAATGWVAK